MRESELRDQVAALYRHPLASLPRCSAPGCKRPAHFAIAGERRAENFCRSHLPPTGAAEVVLEDAGSLVAVAVGNLHADLVLSADRCGRCERLLGERAARVVWPTGAVERGHIDCMREVALTNEGCSFDYEATDARGAER